MIRVQESTHLGPVGSRRTGRAGKHAWCGLGSRAPSGSPRRPRSAVRCLSTGGPERIVQIRLGQLEPPGSHRDISKIAFVEEVKDDIAPGRVVTYTSSSSVQAARRRPPSGGPRARRRSASSWSGAAGARPRRPARGSRATARRVPAPRRARRRSCSAAPNQGLRAQVSGGVGVGEQAAFGDG